jgi:hypothetical protein
MNTTDYRAAPSGNGPHYAEWTNKPHRLVYDLCDEVDRLTATVDGLVALLRMGQELSEAAGDAAFYARDKKNRAVADRDRILGLYTAAITEHGSKE